MNYSELLKKLLTIPGVRALSDDAWEANHRYFDPFSNNDDAFELMVLYGVYVTRFNNTITTHDRNGIVQYTMEVKGEPVAKNIREAIVMGVLELNNHEI